MSPVHTGRDPLSVNLTAAQGQRLALAVVVSRWKHGRTAHSALVVFIPDDLDGAKLITDAHVSVAVRGEANLLACDLDENGSSHFTVGLGTDETEHVGVVTDLDTEVIGWASGGRLCGFNNNTGAVLAGHAQFLDKNLGGLAGIV